MCMKKLNLILSASLMTLICIFSSQAIYAGQVLIRPDVPIITDNNTKAPVSIALGVTQNETDVILNFLYPVDAAQVTVENENGEVVYMETVDTFTTLDAAIDTQNFDGGVYTLKISYGSTDLIGEFEL
jgi:hypothetical protein